MKHWILAGVLLAVLPSAARSQTIEIAPMAGYRFGGTLYSFRPAGGGAPIAALEVGDSPAFGVHLGYRFGEFEFEALYARQATSLETPGLFTGAPLLDLALETWQGGGNYLFATKDARVVPFIGVGARLHPAAAGARGPDRRDALLGFVRRGRQVLAGEARGDPRRRAALRDRVRQRGRLDGDLRPEPWLRLPAARDLYQGEARAGLILRF